MASVDLIELTEDEENAYRLLRGDIMLNRVNSRELVGKCAVVDNTTEGAVFESKNMRVRLDNNRALPEWVAAWLNSHGGREQVGSRLKQIVGQATVNRSDLNSMEVPLPPLSKQKRLATILREQMAAVTWARAAARSQLEAIERLPAALLRQAFNGEL